MNDACNSRSAITIISSKTLRICNILDNMHDVPDDVQVLSDMVFSSVDLLLKRLLEITNEQDSGAD